MSDNPYLDTYWGMVVKDEGTDTEEIVEAVQIRAVDFDGARARVLENTELDGPEYTVKITRYRAESLVESPSDRNRRRRRSAQVRRKSPQFAANKG